MTNFWHNGIKAIIFSAIFLLFDNSGKDEKCRMYFNDSFHPVLVYHVEKVYFHFNDTIPNDTLCVCYSNNGLPLAAYRNIYTGVCDDGLCRIVELRIYWTITGRYLGYMLNPGQELTKKEDIAFTELDYLLLHSIMGDSLSLLAHYSLAGIHPKKINNLQADGISGATIPDLTNYIVPGAAYTSHTLWHLVYGSTRDSLNVFVRTHVTVPLLDSLLKSVVWYDRCWALKMVPCSGFPVNRFIPRALEMLESENYLAVDKALNFFDLYQLPENVYQAKLFQILQSSDFNLKRLAIMHIEKLDSLDRRIALRMIQRLPSESPYMINAFLLVLEKKYKPSEADIQTISILLNHPNKQVALRAYSYLKDLSNKEHWLKRKLKQFLKTT